MGIFDKIKSALGFGDDKKREAQSVETVEAAPETVENLAETSAPVEIVENLAETSAPAEMVKVDMVAILEEKVAESSEDLDWKNSIVDLMKLVGIDSSYANRKELAAEVGIDGYNGTAEQNIELHKVVLKKLAENGGNVPAELLA